MSVISNLVAKFTAETSGFERGAQRVRQQLRHFSSASMYSQRAIRSLTRQLLAFAGVAGLGYMIKRQMTAIDVTAKWEIVSV